MLPPILLSLCALLPQQVADYPIQPVPFHQVKIEDGFWGPRLQTNRDVTLWTTIQKCEETGRIRNFSEAGARLRSGEAGEFEGIYFNDSDVFKVIEGASYTLAQGYDEKIDQKLDEIIAAIASAQEDDGYLYTARTCGDVDYTYPGVEERWAHLAHGHELYNVGHMYEAAVAHFQATGKRSLLDVALKNADLVVNTFGEGPGQIYDTPGHQEIEIGLAKLYRLTGEQKYLDQAQFFLESRGQKDKREKLYGPYVQDHLPVLEQTEAVGHAVRAAYMYSGMADVAALTGNQEYVKVLDKLWEDVVSSKIYLTGGIGARHSGEAFGDAYELPNKTAYNETCAAIANAMWNHRMFLLHGDAKYIDVLERILYNGFLSGISLEGDKFFYPNPLESDGHYAFNRGSLERQGWFDCSCCPVNIVRFIPSLAGMVYATKDDSCYVNLFVNGSAKVNVAGQEVAIRQSTEYPWQGKIIIDVDPEYAAEFEIKVRIPGWAGPNLFSGGLYQSNYPREDPYFALAVIPADERENPDLDELIVEELRHQDSGEFVDGYACIRRKWQPGDRIALMFPMFPRTVVCDDRVEANRSSCAIQCGPLVYCLEEVDNGDLYPMALNATLHFTSVIGARFGYHWKPDLLSGIGVVEGRAELPRPGGGAPIRKEILAIPYFAWGHRGANQMKVWLPVGVESVKPLPIEASFTASTSSCYPSDSLVAIHDGRLPKDSGDHSIPRLTWWDNKGSKEWVEYEFNHPRIVRASEIYWFDDSGQGACRIPKEWNLYYRQYGEWTPVPAPIKGPLPVSKDEWNRLEFPEVEATALRLEVQLQDEFSGGILEWQLDSSRVHLTPEQRNKEERKQRFFEKHGPSKQPNIIVIYADDHSEAAISSYGSKINETPHIDQLAADGMRFSQSFVANSICGPARATLLTGTHSHANGRVNNGSAFNTDLPTWGREMRANGYRTAMIGKWHLPGTPLPQDFDYWARTHGYYANGVNTSEGKDERQGYTVDLITDLGLEWIAEEREEDKPFVLWLSHNAVHRTWMPGPEQLELYRGAQIPEPSTLFDDYAGRSPAAALTQMRISQDLFPAYDLKLPITGEQILDKSAQGRLAPMTKEQRAAWDAAYEAENTAFAEANLRGNELTSWNYQRYIQDYLRCVSALDDSVGKVRQFLADNNLADNTIVIYTSDQGFFLGEHGWYDKRWMYEPALRTPLIIHWPGVTEPGSTSNEMVQNIDMAPTFLEMAGQEVPSTMQGSSLLPLLSNTLEEPWRNAIYYHYQEYNEGRIAHRVAEHYGIRTERYKLIYVYRHDFWELYDLQQDPEEMHNRIDDPELADEVQYLKQRLWRLRQQFGDTTGKDFKVELR